MRRPGLPGASSQLARTLIGVSEPLVCSLTEQAARGQLDEWRRLASDPAVEVTRASPTRLAFHVNDGLDRVEAVVGLAQREKACCPFFDFSLDIATDSVTLVVSVPDEGAPLLDELSRTDQ
jgi:hypothetical protein